MTFLCPPEPFGSEGIVSCTICTSVHLDFVNVLQSTIFDISCSYSHTHVTDFFIVTHTHMLFGVVAAAQAFMHSQRCRWQVAIRQDALSNYQESASFHLPARPNSLDYWLSFWRFPRFGSSRKTVIITRLNNETDCANCTCSGFTSHDRINTSSHQCLQKQV